MSLIDLIIPIGLLGCGVIGVSIFICYTNNCIQYNVTRQQQQQQVQQVVEEQPPKYQQNSPPNYESIYNNNNN